MAASVTHATTATLPDDPSAEIGTNEWNAAHTVTGVVEKSSLAAKGDLISASAAATVSVVTAGANDTILMADSAQTAGLKWVASATPSTQALGDAAAVGTSDTFTRGDHKHAMPTFGSIVEQLLSSIVDADPMLDAKVVQGNVIGLGFFATSSSGRVTATNAVHTVTGGKTFIVVHYFASKNDASFHSIYLRNTTDSTDVMSAANWALGATGSPFINVLTDFPSAGSWLYKVAAGKAIALQVGIPDAAQRAMGGILIGVEV